MLGQVRLLQLLCDNPLVGAMSKAFPDIDPEWYTKVMFPAFAENLTLLFERKH